MSKLQEIAIKVGSFFHLIDLDNQIDLTNIAFMIIMGKIVVASQLDWPSVVTLATVILNKIHKRRVDSSFAEEDEKALSTQLEEQKKQLEELKNKLSPIIDKIKENI